MDTVTQIPRASADLISNAGSQKGNAPVCQQPDLNSPGRVSQPHPRANSANKNSTPPLTGETDVQECLSTLALLHQPGTRFEIRVLPQGQYRRFNATPEGLQEAALYAAGWSDCHQTKGVYTTLNPIGTEPEKAATDACIERRRYLLIDVDPVRPANTNATEAECDAAAQVFSRVRTILFYYGGLDLFHRHVEGFSGNGYHANYPIDLPNDEPSRELLQDILKELAFLCDKPWATVDTAVYNASRIVKLYGTLTRKGPHSEERPWRKAWTERDKFIDLTPYPAEQLYELRRNLIWQRQPQKALVNPNLAIAGPRIAENTVIDVTPQPEPPPYAPHAPQSNGQDDHWKMPVGVGADALTRARAYVFAPGFPDSIDGKHGHDRLYHVACVLIDGFGLTRDQALPIFHDWNAAKAKPPESVFQVEHKIDSAIKNHPVPSLKQLNADRRDKSKTKDGQKMDQNDTVEDKDELSDDDLIVNAHMLKPRRIDWLWQDRVPKRFITVFYGKTAVGKSFLALDIAARVTKGAEWPFGKGECAPQGNVLIISEDPQETMLIPRLMSLGADLSRVKLMSWKAMMKWTLNNMDLLKRVFKKAGNPIYIMIDPPTNFLGDKDEHRNSEVRSSLMCLVDWLANQETATACTLCTHTSKPTGKTADAIFRMIGSVAWGTTARIAFGLDHDPEDRSRYIFACAKTNIGELPKALVYQTERHVLHVEGEGNIQCAKVKWIGESDASAEDVMCATPGHTKSKVKTVQELLIDMFNEKQEWAGDEFWKQINQHGFTKDDVSNAKRKLAGYPKATPHPTIVNQFTWSVPIDWEYLKNDNEPPL